MTFRHELRWGGLLIILTALIVSLTNGLFYLEIHNPPLHALYGAGFSGLILVCSIMHMAQARRAGLFEAIMYLLTLLFLAYLNVSTFMDLVKMAGIPGTEQAISVVQGPFLVPVIYGLYLCLILFCLASAQVGVLPRGGSVLTALGIALQLPAEFARNLAGPMFYIFSAGGSFIFGAGLIWVGWFLWSSESRLDEEPGLSSLDRRWGIPLVWLTALLLFLAGLMQLSGKLTSLGGRISVLSLTALLLSIVVLFMVQADRAGLIGWLGFAFTQLGAALTLIPAYLLTDQLAGRIDSNRALLVSWAEYPFGKAGVILLLVGLILFGLSVTRARLLPQASGWLCVLGTVLVAPRLFQAPTGFFSVLSLVGTLLLGIGWGWMGWGLVKNSRSPLRDVTSVP